MVKKRIRVEVIDGVIKPIDQESSFAEADRIAGKKLDRRRHYLIINGMVNELRSWRRACHNCVYDGEGASSNRGAGCRECGHQGVCREEMWLPISGAASGSPHEKAEQDQYRKWQAAGATL